MNEFQIIDLLTRVAGKLPPEYASIGDDVATVRTPRGKLILKVDMLVGSTDIPPGMTLRQAGRKALVACVSDFASKGVRPRALMLSLGITRKMRDDEIRSLVKGFADGMKEWQLSLIGGDTNEAADLVVDCTMVGFADRIVERSGSEPGDAVVVTGDFGRVSAGLKILLEGAASAPAFRRGALRSVYLPQPRLELGLALRDLFSSSMDSSDGLALCLHALADAGRTGFRIDSLPQADGIEEFAARNGYSARDLVLYGGEEYEIVGTVPWRKLERARSIARSLGTRLQAIGEVTRQRKVETAAGEEIERRGWVQLA